MKNLCILKAVFFQSWYQPTGQEPCLLQHIANIFTTSLSTENRGSLKTNDFLVSPIIVKSIATRVILQIPCQRFITFANLHFYENN